MVMMAGLESIVPDAVPNELQVVYAGDVRIASGLQLRPRQVRDPPVSVAWDADAGALYTLLMVDPDAPSRQNPTRRDCLHWMVINIAGGDLAKGETKAEYIGSGPPAGTGLHRYVVLACRQPGPLHLDDMGAIKKTQVRPRVCFPTRQFLERHDLRPVAGTFFEAEWDDYVPELHAQFTDRIA